MHSQRLDSLGEYLTSLRLWYKSADCYLSLYRYVMVDGRRVFAPDHKFTKLFFEVDGKGETNSQVLKDAKEKALSISNILTAMGIKFIVLFSGNRSFHFHILLGRDPEPIGNFGVAVRSVFSSLMPYVDLQCVGDASRVSRIVNTVHSSTGLFVVQVDDVGNFDTSMATEPKGFHYAEPNEWLVAVLNLAGGKASEYNSEYECQSESLVPYCVLEMIHNLVEYGRASDEHGTEHMARIHLAASLYKFGYDQHFVWDLFSVAEDFEERKAKTQLNSVWSRLKPYSCDRLKLASLCTMLLGCPWEY